MRFNWDESYSVGVKTFDDQHIHFFELANDAYNLLEKDNTDKEKLVSVVNNMVNYLVYHLNSEEEVFAQYGYLGAEVHIQAHNGYKQKVKELFEESRRATPEQLVPLTKNVVDFATDWLVSHIISMDKEYTSFLKGKEIQI